LGNRSPRNHPSDLTPLLTALGVDLDAELLTLESKEEKKKENEDA